MNSVGEVMSKCQNNAVRSSTYDYDRSTARLLYVSLGPQTFEIRCPDLRHHISRYLLKLKVKTNNTVFRFILPASETKYVKSKSVALIES